ncbi:MAG: TetR/AcrR family transcriptional regulator [Aestuariivirga sp.]
MGRPTAIKQRDPIATQKRILLAAKAEFSRKGLGGARVDAIAARARSNKRMLYHYFGNKEDLFTRTLENAYGDFRAAEAALEIEKDDPVTALRRLMQFTWDYYLANPEFITLVNSENLHKARHLRSSDLIEDINKNFVARMQALLKRGAAQGQFRKGLDPVQILIALAGLGFHYLNNRHTGEIVYGRELMNEAALRERGRFNIDAILRIVCTPETLLKMKDHN